MATIATKNLEVVGYRYSNTLPTARCFEGASQTWSVGDVLGVSSGRAVIAAEGDNADTLLGQATSPASGTTDTRKTYTPFVPGIIIQANLMATSAAARVLAITDMFTSYGLGLSGGNFFLLYAASPTAADVFAKIIDVGERRDGVIGDTNVRVLAEIVDSAFITA